MTIRRRTTCRTPGHGTRCEVAAEIPRRHPRTTEQRLALAYEAFAEHGWRYPTACTPANGTRPLRTQAVASRP